MAFYIVKTSAEAIREDYIGSNRINKSGIYDVTIEHVIVDTPEKGGMRINLMINYEGFSQTIYNAITMVKTDGTPSKTADMLSKLAIVCGAGDGQVISDPVTLDLPIGKNRSLVPTQVLQDFDDMKVSIRIVMSYGIWDDKIREKMTIRNFFRYPDHATASEIVNKAEVGKQYAIELKDADKTIYENELTAEDVEKWKQERTSGTQEEEKPVKKPSWGERRQYTANTNISEEDLPF